MISSYEVRTYWTTTLGRAQGCQQAAGAWAGDLTTSILSANLIVHYITPRIVTNTCKVAGKTLNLISPLPSGSAAEKVRKNAPYETRPPPGRGPEPLRRTAARSFSPATKQRRFQDVEGRCEACGELIGDGTDWRRAIYHHRRLVSDPNVSDKEARSAANCMVLHPACHDDPVEFYNLHGFYPDNLKRK
jgi:hypothetical protein